MQERETLLNDLKNVDVLQASSKLTKVERMTIEQGISRLANLVYTAYPTDPILKDKADQPIADGTES